LFAHISNRKLCQQTDGKKNDGTGKVIDNLISFAGFTVVEVNQHEGQRSNTASDEMRFAEYVAQTESIVNLQADEINEGLYGRVTKKIVVHPDKVLEIYLSFMKRPIFLQYKTSGRGEAYQATFTIVEP